MAELQDLVTDEHLLRLDDFTTDLNWEVIAIRILQLRDGEIETIRENYRYNADMIRIKIWKRWKDRFAHEATYSLLIERAETYGYVGLANKVRSLSGSTPVPVPQPPSALSQQQLGESATPPPPTPIKSPSQKFPELITLDLSTDERQALEARLVAETEQMRSEFTILLGKTVNSLEKRGIKTEHLMLIFRRHYKGLYRRLNRRDSIALIFTKADDYWSFFEYEVLAIIINVHGSTDDKRNIDHYIEQLREYCKRRICEVPLKAFKKKSDKHEELYLKVERSLDYPMKKLKKLEYRLSHILNHNLHLVNIKRGCLELTFVCGVEFEDIFPLSESQKRELDNCDVLKLYSKSGVYYECDSSFPNYQYSHSSDFSLRIDELQLKLSKIMTALSNSLSEEKIPVKRIANHIRGLSERIYQSLLTAMDNLSHSNEYLLMSELEKYIHLFNLCLLKEIAKVCASNGGTVLMKEIESFENEVDVFRSTISVDIFLKCQKLDEQKLPENYEELTVVMEGQPADFTLNDLEEHRMELCHQLEKRWEPHLIEHATIFQRIEAEAGSSGVSVTWILPPDIASDLKVKIRNDDNLNFFERKGVTSLSIHGRCFYSRDSQRQNLRSVSSSSNSGIIRVLSNSGGSQNSGEVGRRRGSAESQRTAPSQLSVNDLKLEFENRSTNTATNGQFPSICMSNKRWIVQAYHHETVVLLRMRYRIGFLSSKGIIWSQRHMIFNRGFYPRMAINASGLVVVVYASQVGRMIYYRVGKLVSEHSNTTNTLTAPPSQQTLNTAYIHWQRGKVLFAEGRNPSVSLSDSGTVAIAYERGYISFETFYRLGDIADNGEDIEWRSDGAHHLIQTQSSKHVSIAINDLGQVAMGFSSGHEALIHYKGGEISKETESADTIVLHDDIFTPTAGQNYQPFISLNNHGHVMAVHHGLQGRLNIRTNYGIMSLDETTRLTRIEWATPICAQDLSNNGHYASVAINDHMEVVTAHKSLTLNIHKSMRNYVGSLSYAYV